MIDRLIGYLEIALLRRCPQFSIALRSRRFHRIQEDSAFLALYDELQHRQVLLQSVSEAYNLWLLCQQSAKIPGDVAELGVYLGGTARMLAEIKGNRRLFLFDTFGDHGGMPTTKKGVDIMESGTFTESRLKDVQLLLSEKSGVHFCPGFFPDTTKLLPSDAQHFSFVHLDVDIYQSTLDGLKFFYPRLSPGGMLVSHDYRYTQCPGVKRAFDEFFADKPEHVVELWDTQCLVIKT